MGTRINYAVVDLDEAASVERGIIAVLYSNGHHNSYDPEQAFMDAVEKSAGPTSLVRTLLNETYPQVDSGASQTGAVFSLDYAAGDNETVYIAVYKDGGEPYTLLRESMDRSGIKASIFKHIQELQA